MKTLYFFRHGKSDWNADFSRDHERPINKRGREAARQMGRFLAEAEQLPDRILTSSAVRARETLAQAQRADGWAEIPVRVTDALYEATPRAILEEIHGEADDAERLLLVGHEPTWSQMVELLIGGGDIRFPTATVARVDVDVEAWADVAPGRGRLIWLMPPRSLP